MVHFLKKIKKIIQTHTFGRIQILFLSLFIYLLDVGMDDPDDAMFSEPIPLADVEGAILQKVIIWCQHHKDGFIIFSI